MILPVVRERLERLLRLSAVEGALGALRSGESKIQFSGLQPTAKALLATYLAGELRRPAFFLVASNKQAESIAETLRFFASVFSAGNVAVLPAFDTLPWDARSPHAWATAERQIPGSIRITVDELPARLSDVPRGLPIVTYCT